MSNRRNFVLTFLVLGLMGVVAISNIAGKPASRRFTRLTVSSWSAPECASALPSLRWSISSAALVQADPKSHP